MTSQLMIGDVLRYPQLRAGDSVESDIDGYRNFYSVTGQAGLPALKLDRGINQPATTPAPDGKRVAVLALSSSPHKVGHDVTPWQDVFDVDNGYVRYFGDNRTPGKDPWDALGNKQLLEQRRFHGSPDQLQRRLAAPIVLFKRVPRQGKQKGFVQFEGLAVLRRSELVTQLGAQGYFTNCMFELTVLTMKSESETFDWQWIKDRRNPAMRSDEAERRAPVAWKTWVREGEIALPRVRRHVAGRSIVPSAVQKPEPSSAAAEVLAAVYRHYDGRKVKFEAVAAWVVDRILSRNGAYMPYGVTRASGDRGFDFVGRLELGEGFGAVRVVVLGQAKCEKPGVPTNGVHVARTVARLRRGWIGAYVTTSFYSPSVQAEVIQDRYPLLLVNGLQLATEIANELLTRGWPPLEQLLGEIEREFGHVTEMVDPEQILLD